MKSVNTERSNAKDIIGKAILKMPIVQLHGLVDTILAQSGSLPQLDSVAGRRYLNLSHSLGLKR